MKYTEELDKVSYCFGLSIASNLLSSGVNTINTEAFVDAIRTVYAGQMPEIKPEEAFCRTILTNCKTKEARLPRKPENNS